MPLLSLQVPSPFGPLTLIEKDKALVALDWSAAGSFLGTPLLQAMAQQLYQYFAGERRDFAFPVAPVCTAFEQRVFSELRAIPYGVTRSYGEIAGRTGGDRLAVIAACRANPCPIVIPCHRATDNNGGLGLFEGQVFESPGAPETKERLLRLEGVPLPAAAVA